ncbi:MAG: hypothetical protein GWN07_06210 [Actinobacteria bacterium]|nr:hypothetical protein [Actinomycetota bacterium]NIU65086.1 hypothetical protein [Actinomycetota bacterium]NIV86154.1 hypothetical protein [Actinomycetota bacterium]NIW26887.1 hypothetical protein [Actinomycetota bacterium]NIX19442.1 hypothetical protein [Actinomycetota bacterium]
MADPPSQLTESPVDFETAVAYALSPVMRRLIILYVVGVLLLPVGMGIFLGTPLHTLLPGLVLKLVGLLLAVAGAALLFAGLFGAAFKLVTDANRVAVDG